jgi:DNA ligase-associated metallophosphoesterase
MLRPERLDLRDGKTHEFAICGKLLVADQSGALYWPAEQALIVSDLHLEKASAAAERGRHLPPYDTRETLMKLAEAIDRFEPRVVVALGDSMHDEGAAARITEDDLNILHMLQEDRSWIWVTGNHDPEIAPLLGGEVCQQLTLEGLTLRHEPQSGRVTHEIAGHLHPAARLSMYGHTIRRPCFIANGRRVVIPAFGAFTGGLNVLNVAFEPLFGSDGINVYMLGQEGLYPVASRLLRDD